MYTPERLLEKLLCERGMKRGINPRSRAGTVRTVEKGLPTIHWMPFTPGNSQLRINLVNK